MRPTEARREEAVLRIRPAEGAALAARHIVVAGSGRLARSLCHGLAAGPAPEPVLVTVLARDRAAAAGIARTGQVRAVLADAAVRFAATEFPDEPAEDEHTLDRLRPTVLVCVASAQSPYEAGRAPSAWTGLIARAGFGVTLALQTQLVLRLAGALAEVSPDTLLVNGCFPDAVNPLLAALGRPVHCGVGNVATLAACLQASLDLPDQRGLQVLGHHAHLGPPDGAGAAAPDGPAEVRVWRDGRPVAGVTSMLAGYRALPRPELNAIAGQAAARLVAQLVTGTADLHTNLPGPLGLPGGYPVRLRGRDIALNLPAGLSQGEAVAWNTAAGRRDGVEVTAGRVSYPRRTRDALAAYLPDLATGWPVTDLPEVATQFTALRRELRQRPRPAQPVPAGRAD